MRLVKDAPGVYRLADQMARIPSIMNGGSPDDWADAAADIFNEAVYTPVKRIGGKREEHIDLKRPGDEILKGLRDEDAVKVYDEFWSEERRPYEPIV